MRLPFRPQRPNLWIISLAKFPFSADPRSLAFSIIRRLNLHDCRFSGTAQSPANILETKLHSLFSLGKCAKLEMKFIQIPQSKIDGVPSPIEYAATRCDINFHKLISRALIPPPEASCKPSPYFERSSLKLIQEGIMGLDSLHRKSLSVVQEKIIVNC